MTLCEKTATWDLMRDRSKSESVEDFLRPGWQRMNGGEVIFDLVPDHDSPEERFRLHISAEDCFSECLIRAGFGY